MHTIFIQISSLVKNNFKINPSAKGVYTVNVYLAVRPSSSSRFFISQVVTSCENQLVSAVRLRLAMVLLVYALRNSTLTRTKGYDDWSTYTRVAEKSPQLPVRTQ